ncbi:MAG: heme o synthase [Phycisphaerales bacterium]|nr:heme o synthase [Phycisphaerales bacterium]
MADTAADTSDPTTPATTGPVAVLKMYADLVKLRLSLLVVVTAGVGCIMASGSSIQWLVLIWAVTGTLACAAAANAINQIIETRRDALMARTKERPLPSGAMSPAHGWILAMLLGYGGVAMLALLVNLFTAGLALLTLLLYVLAYTPLKPLSTLNTMVGAIVGAIPPMIGWVAIRGQLDLGAWILGAILFLWQLPHFLSLAWIYRDQYEGAGFRMLPSAAGGDRPSREAALLSCLLLIPLALLMVTLQLAGTVYAACAIILGLGFAWKAVRFYRTPSRDTARSLFLTSLLYLPLILLAMVLDRIPLPDELFLYIEPSLP